MPKKVFIYCLKNPTTGDVRYIGQTNNLKRRLQDHLRDSSKLKTHLGKWLRSLGGEKPLLAVLHEVAENESWSEEEIRYISCARALGVNLVNSTDGGEGISGPKSPEWRAAMKRPKSSKWKAAMTAPRPKEWCVAISAGLTGKKATPEACANMSATRKGVPPSPAQAAHLRKMSAAHIGVPTGPHSPAHCAAISASKKGVRRGPDSPERCAAVSAGLRASPVFAAYVAGKVGVPLTKACRAALSAAKKGVRLSPEHCAALSAAHIGVPWSPARRAAYEAGKLAKLAAK